MVYNFNVSLFVYGATPGDNSGYTNGRMDVYAEQAGTGAYRFTFNDGNFDEFEIVAAPVPVPVAVWLLGSGMIGLVGIRRHGSRHM